MGVFSLAQPGGQRTNPQITVEPSHQIEKVVTVETDGDTFIYRRQKQFTEALTQHIERGLYVSITLNIAANADKNPGHVDSPL